MEMIAGCPSCPVVMMGGVHSTYWFYTPRTAPRLSSVQPLPIPDRSALVAPLPGRPQPAAPSPAPPPHSHVKAIKGGDGRELSDLLALVAEQSELVRQPPMSVDAFELLMSRKDVAGHHKKHDRGTFQAPTLDNFAAQDDALGSFVQTQRTLGSFVQTQRTWAASDGRQASSFIGTAG